MSNYLSDIKPYSPVSALDKTQFNTRDHEYSLDVVSEIVGMSPIFTRKIIGDVHTVKPPQLLTLLEQDCYGETYIPRSRVLEYVTRSHTIEKKSSHLELPKSSVLIKGNAYDLIDQLPPGAINCVVTSPPYWGTRIYDHCRPVAWGDGESCMYGHEQTPEAYIRHTVELLSKLKRALSDDGSIWWNVMDTFNTRTQIRTNAVEALRAMQGKEKNSWRDYDCRRYSAGHAFLKDGEQCSIPARIAERASRIGLYVKTVITWAKTGSLPEPQNSRVSRNLEYVLHLTKQRTPFFQKEMYRTTPARLGGRNNHEAHKLGDVWYISTTSGKDGHGAQFSLALPGRCIALSTRKKDLVLDPFVGGGTSGIAAVQLGRRFIGFDVSKNYLATAKKHLTPPPSRTNQPRSVLAYQEELTL